MTTQSNPKRVCNTCKEEKDEDQFYPGNKYKDKQYPRYQCKQCDKNKKKEYQKDPEVRSKYDLSNRKGYLMRTYGITLEQYEEMFERQGGRCAICEKHQEELKKRLAVDHNHETREIRGLLCDYCNHRVIGRHKDGNLLRKMANYVDQGTGWFVPKKKRTVKRKPKK